MTSVQVTVASPSSSLIPAWRGRAPAWLAAPVAVPRLASVTMAAAFVALPLLRPSGPANSSPVDLPMAASIWVVLLWAGCTRLPLRFPYACSVGVLMLGGAVGAIAGPQPLLSQLAIAHDAFLLAWCLAIVNVCRNGRVLAMLLRAWGWSAVVWGVILIVAYFTGRTGISGVTPENGARAAFTLGDPNLAANYFVLSIVAIVATGWPRRWSVRAGGCLILMASLALTGSNGGILALLLAFTVERVLWAGRRFGPAAAAAICCVALLLIGGAVGTSALTRAQEWARGTQQPLLRDSIGRSNNSASQRQVIAHETAGLYRQSAPWGFGPGTTKALLDAQQAPYPHEAHDDFIESVVERGVIGVIGMLMLFGAVTVRLGSIARSKLKPEFAAAVPRVDILIGAAVALTVSATYYQIQHFRHVWALLAVIAALQVWGRVGGRPRTA